MTVRLNMTFITRHSDSS